MLYERWQQVASEHRHEWALRDAASGRCWTFEELQRAADMEPLGAGPIVHPQEHSPQFIYAVLQAWSSGRVVCPLEPGQLPPRETSPPAWCAHLKTTSATTGPPRRVAFTSEQLMADAANIVATMGLRPDWPNLGAISLAHSYGFSNLVLPLLLHGIPLVLLSSPLPEAVRRAAELGSAWTLPAVPALWRAWHDAQAIPDNVRLAISASAPLPLALETTVFETTGVKIHNFYGSTECGGIAYDRSLRPRGEDACVGTALENVHLSIGERGCLEVRGRAVGATYWPEPASELADGCFRTSDLVELKDGHVYLRGRASDLINVAGRKVAPEMIERALGEHPAVAACLVFGVPEPDADRGELTAAAVVIRLPVSAETLRQFLLERLPAWQVPRDWRFVESLAPNERGKISRAAWRHKFVEERGKENSASS